MIECNECRTLNRRDFLARAGTGLGAVALADPLLRSVASTYGQAAGGTGNLLVLCQLQGGLDALEFLAPFQNASYQSNRPSLALAPSEVTALPDAPEYGINNLFSFFSEMYTQQQVAIVQQVAYPGRNGSHFHSQDIFEFGARDLGSGAARTAPWYERLRQTYFDEPLGFLDIRKIGDPTRYGYPDGTSRRAAQAVFGQLARLKTGRTPQEQAVLDSYDKIDTTGEVIRTRTADFVSTGSARGEFYRAAQLASADVGTQILKVRYGGFDTHGDQRAANQTVLTRVNDQFRQFVDDLKALGIWQKTCVCFYTEFGRRNFENGSPGTDHGYAGHMILVGPGVNGGLHGQNVTTADLTERSLPYYVDFRAVFGACIQDWLGFDPAPIFQFPGETYDADVGSSLFV